MSQIVPYILYSTSVLSFHIDAVKTLFLIIFIIIIKLLALLLFTSNRSLARNQGSQSQTLQAPADMYIFGDESTQYVLSSPTSQRAFWCAILIAHQIVMAKHGGSCVHFSGISICGRTSRETVSHSQRQPLPTPHKIALPVYVNVTNKRLQPLTTTLYNSLVLSFSLLTTKRRLIKHRNFLRVLRSS